MNSPKAPLTLADVLHALESDFASYCARNHLDPDTLFNFHLAHLLNIATSLNLPLVVSIGTDPPNLRTNTHPRIAAGCLVESMNLIPRLQPQMKPNYQPEPDTPDTPNTENTSHESHPSHSSTPTPKGA